MADTHQEPVVAPLVHDTKSETPLTTSTEPATDSTTAAPSGTESAKEPVLGATDNVSPDATEPSASATDATPTASVTSGYLSYKAPGLLKLVYRALHPLCRLPYQEPLCYQKVLLARRRAHRPCKLDKLHSYREARGRTSQCCVVHKDWQRSALCRQV